MPRMDGYTVYEKVKSLHPKMLTVFVTANSDPLKHKVPKVPHITKPFKQRALLKAVRNTLDGEMPKKS